MIFIAEKQQALVAENLNKPRFEVDSGEQASGFSAHLNAAMTESQKSNPQSEQQSSQSNSQKSFVNDAMEAIIMQRLGLNKEQIDKIKAAMEELKALFEQGKISEEDFKKQMEELEKMLEAEYAKGRERAEQDAKKHAGLI